MTRIQIYVNFERTTNASMSDIDSDIDGWKYIRILQRNSSCGVKNGIISPNLFFSGCRPAWWYSSFFLTFFDSYWNRRTMLVQFEPKNINRKNKNDETTRSSSNPSKSLLSNLLRHWFAFFRKKKEHVVHIFEIYKNVTCRPSKEREGGIYLWCNNFLFFSIFLFYPTYD